MLDKQVSLKFGQLVPFRYFTLCLSLSAGWPRKRNAQKNSDFQDWLLHFFLFSVKQQFDRLIFLMRNSLPRQILNISFPGE